MDDPPQKIAFFMTYCLRSSLHRSRLVSIISVRDLLPFIYLKRISLGEKTHSFESSMIEPSGNS